ncbi:MAG TPA: response regulator [Candidatus Competibacter phosphatis]|nr:response regulator [Candidatus Competibacter phosphatis]HMR02176.1 response regulator [Candidatus Competibacter phosphatis]
MRNAREQMVFIVDDDAAVRDSIQELVESVGLRAEGYASAFAFLDGFQPRYSGCLVLDVRMAAMSGLALQERLNELGFRIPVIMLTGHGDVPMAVQAMKAGAVDFIQKPYRDQTLLDSINAALVLDAAARHLSNAAESLEHQLATLTEREREVLNQTLTGSTSKEIARELSVSPRTVEAHRQNLLRKLGIGTVKELMLHLIPQVRDR